MATSNQAQSQSQSRLQAQTSRPHILATHYRFDPSDHADGDDCTVFVRYHGREFQIEMAPRYLRESPCVTGRYSRFLGALRGVGVVGGDKPGRNGNGGKGVGDGSGSGEGDGEGKGGGESEGEGEEKLKWGTEEGEEGEGKEGKEGKEEDVEESEEDDLEGFYAWLMTTFEPVFKAAAPDIPPSFDPEKIATGKARPTLGEYLLPEVYSCRLEAENDKPVPVYLRGEKSHFLEPLVGIPADLTEELRRHVRFFGLSEVGVSFKRPEDALSLMPTRVLVDMNGDGPGKGKTTCFFKGWGGGRPLCPGTELAAHLRVLKSSLPHEARVPRLLGVVAAADGWVAGWLLTNVDHRRESELGLQEYLLRSTPVELRQRWASQIRKNVRQLHEAGVVWGGARADNVLVDRNGDAWLTGLNWDMDRELERGAGFTEKEDLQGVDRIVEYLFSEDYEPGSEDGFDSE